MGESLTPKLTREQFRAGYMSYLAKENSVNLMNLAANQTFALEGETLGVLYNQSSTIAGISREQKLAIVALKMQGYLKQPDITVRKLPSNQLDLLYVGIDQIKVLMAESRQIPMDSYMFQQFMSQLLNAAKDTAGFQNDIATATPGAGDLVENNTDLHHVAQTIDPTAAATGAANADTIDPTAAPGGPVDMGGGQPETTNEDLGPNEEEQRRADVSMQINNTMSKINSLTDEEDGRELIQLIKDEHRAKNLPTNAKNALLRAAVKKIKELRESRGAGLMQQLRKQRRTGQRGPRGRIIMGEGLVNFGKYKLDMHDLDNNDKVCIRYDCGKLVRSIPAKIVGGSVSGALKAITNGKNPSARDVEGMTEEERNYLNLISKKAAVKDLQVPSKDKSADEKELHKFETMKGQIIAGNDNAQLIKDFKLLLIKLKQKHKVSKDDANDILLELAALGY